MADGADLDAALLRVFAEPDRAAGMAFLVTDRLAITCAHVVTGHAVEVDLPLRGSDRVVATVERSQPSADVAVLRLDRALPGARPVQVLDADDLWGHPARAFGLPRGRPAGVWHSAVLRHRQANGLVQFDLVGDGYRVEPGFSGGPVWDDELGGVVGMVVLAEAVRPPVGYLIPKSGLVAAWPELADLRPPSPFRGLRAFEEADAALFHGREAESDEVAWVLGGERRTTLVGPSGCGKSSLALAGVVPKRRTAGDLPVVVRPGRHIDPVHALAAALLPSLAPELSETQRLVETPALAEVLAAQGLHGVVPRLLDLTGAERLLVVVDQYEELLDQPPEAVGVFTRVLFSDDTPDTVKVLSTLRADFLEPVLAHPRLGSAVGRVCALEPMRSEQLREIITRPVDEVPGVRYEPNLAERILKDAGTLPLLGFTLDLLWQRQSRGLLTHAAYDEMGGVAGALGRYADQVWPAEADHLLTRLVRLPIGAAAATRRVVPRTELTEHEWHLAQRLAATRLLVLSDTPAAVELAHEALITGWHRLADRIAADRAFLDWRETVRHDLHRWERGDRAADLLPSETALTLATRWLPDRAAELTDHERDFLAKGHSHHRTRSRRRRVLVSAAVIVVVALVLFGSLFVYAEGQRARQTALANSRALAQASQDLALEDPALSVMTALAAYRTSPTQEARNQLLHNYLAHSPSKRVISGVPGDMRAFDTSGDGDVVLASTDLGHAMLFVRAVTGTVRSQTVPSDYVLYTLVSQDGRRAAFVDENGGAGWFEVRPDDAEPVGQVHRLPTVDGLPSRPEAATISADGSVVAFSAGGRLVAWDLDKDTTTSLPAPVDPTLIFDLWFGSGNRTLLVGVITADARGLTSVDLGTGTATTVLPLRQDQNYLLSGDRGSVAVCHVDGNRPVVQLKRFSDGADLGNPYRGAGGSCWNLEAIDPTGRWLVVAEEGGFTVVDLGPGVAVSRIAAKRGLADTVRDMLVVGDELWLAMPTYRSIVYVRAPTTAQVLDVADALLTDDGSETVILLKDGRMQRRRVEDDALLAEAPTPLPHQSDTANRLRRSGDGSLVAHHVASGVVVVHDAATLRETVRITTEKSSTPPPTTETDTPNPERGEPADQFSFNFDLSGNLLTISGSIVQYWDPRTGAQLARLDTTTLLPPGTDPSTARVGPYPAVGQVYLVTLGDPTARVVELATGRTTATLSVPEDTTAIQFHPSGRFFAVLRQSAILELWTRDPAARSVGPLRSLAGIPIQPFDAGFVGEDGRYVVAANNSVRFYRIGTSAPVESYDFGHPDGTVQNNPYSFIDVSGDGRTVLYREENGPGGPLALDPEQWAQDLCGIIARREFTPEDRAGVPAEVPTQQICPE